MNPDDPDFEDWAAKRIAEILLYEDREAYAERYPSEELNHVFKVLDERIAPELAANGVPISRDDLHTIFLYWFVRKDSPRPLKRAQRPRGDEIEPGLERETSLISPPRGVAEIAIADP